MVSLFSAQGVVIRDVEHEGRDALVALYQAWAESQPTDGVLRHHVTSPMIHCAGDTATSVSYLRADMVRSDGTWAVDVSHYDDRLERDRDAGWILTRREIGIEARITSDGPAVVAHRKWGSPTRSVGE